VPERAPAEVRVRGGRVARSANRVTGFYHYLGLRAIARRLTSGTRFAGTVEAGTRVTRTRRAEASCAHPD